MSRLIRQFLLAMGAPLAACGGRPAPPPAAAPPIEYWRLPTGSRIALAHFPAAPPSSGPPIVFLHGGPGAYQLSHLQAGRVWYARLASGGRDIYLYDQAGGGLSDRLADPTQYTVARQVADLEAIRARIGAERLTLVGDSWGASLASAYIAGHPERVERVVFTSPGAIHGAAWLAPLPAPRIPPEILGWARGHRSDVAYRRLLEADRLLRQDARRAHAFLGDAEMDGVMDDFVTDTILPTTVHDPVRVRSERMSGMGGWAMVMTNWDQVNSAPDPRPRLAAFHGPVLVLRGEADYLPAGIAEEYARVFPQARFIRVAGAGHLIWLEQPQVYGTSIEEFVLRREASSSASAWRCVPRWKTVSCTAAWRATPTMPGVSVGDCCPTCGEPTRERRQAGRSPAGRRNAG